MPGGNFEQFHSEGNDKPLLKAAYIDSAPIFAWRNQLETLVNVKSKQELVGDIVIYCNLLPTKMLFSGSKIKGGKLAGIVKTLQKKEKIKLNNF